MAERSANVRGCASPSFWEGIMAERTEHTFNINRRRLLASAAAATTAAIVPPAGETARAASTQPGPRTAEAPVQEFSSANARRLSEISERNRLRQEFGLPRLSVVKELRRMKAADDAVDYQRFSDDFRNRDKQKTLARIRRRQNDPHWEPTNKWAGISFETEVSERLTRLFARIG
jgi:hypothetical protein